jgi:hypothetical protein
MLAGEPSTFGVGKADAASPRGTGGAQYCPFWATTQKQACTESDSVQALGRLTPGCGWVPAE